MQNNYYFLRQLSTRLENILLNGELATCFSQEKDELIIGFLIGKNLTEEFYIKATLTPQFCCLSFPNSYNRSKKNSVDLFENLIGKKVIGIHQSVNDRSFYLSFAGEEASNEKYQLIFKMHGNRSNLILVKSNKVIEIFNNRLKKDANLQIENLDRQLDQSYEAFEQADANYKKVYPTFGKEVEQYLTQQQYDEMDIKGKWRLINKVRETLENPDLYYISVINNSPTFTLLPFGNLKEEFTDPIEAINQFFLAYHKLVTVENEKHLVVKQLEDKRARTVIYLKKNQERLHELGTSKPYDQMADVIMANLHQIPTGTEKVNLFNFYTSQEITINLKKDLSPQKNAENYYRKAKNKGIELEKIQKNLDAKEALLLQLDEYLEQIKGISDIKTFRQFVKENELVQAKNEEEHLPFKQFSVLGYEVYVGKSAVNNDEMLRKFSWKEDLWLHVKDVPGSHVIIKHQSGKKFPSQVIEKAAQLAAYYSKRKTDTLCPVIYTPRKYVRKSKGMTPGQVMVIKESVIMVEPALPMN